MKRAKKKITRQTQPTSLLHAINDALRPFLFVSFFLGGLGFVCILGIVHRLLLLLFSFVVVCFLHEKALRVRNSSENGSICFSADQISEMKFTIYSNELYVLDFNCQTLNVQMEEEKIIRKQIQIPNAIVQS